MRAAPFIIFLNLFFSITCFSQGEPFSKRTVISGLNSPWEVLYGPNDSLWVTESVTYLVKRVRVSNGSSTTLLNLSGMKNFSSGDGGRQPQGGLMGMALHPNLFSADPSVRAAKPWVYIAYVFNRPTGQTCTTNPNSSNPCNFLTRIVRYEYSGNALINPVTLLDNMPGSNDHNSGRLTIGPDLKVYYTIGDMGAGQFNNASRTNNAQVLDVLEGKVLRLNTETDGDAGADAWVPDDNPYYNGSPISPRDYVYSTGHRNAQGIVWATVGGLNYLYSSEHGDKSDDEVNIISGGSNFGWNEMVGYNDNNYNGLTLGGNSSVNEGTFCSGIANESIPIYTMFTRNQAQINSLSGDYLTWPTVAPSSIDFYRFSKIPGWQNSLLIPCLKAGKVFRIKLNNTGTAIIPLSGSADTASYFRGEGRFRDMAISPGGTKFYLACDASGQTSGPTGGFNGGGTPPPNAGSIMEFTYTGIVLPVHDLIVNRPVTEKAIKVYPVPAGKEVTVSVVSDTQKPYFIRMYTLNGIEVKELKTIKSQTTIDISTLASGMYLIQVSNGIGQVLETEKIFKL